MYKSGRQRLNRKEVKQRRSKMSKKIRKNLSVFFLADGPDRGSVREAGRWEETLQSEATAGCDHWTRKNRTKEKEGIKMLVLFQMTLQTLTPDPTI